MKTSSGNKTYTIELLKKVTLKDIPKLPHSLVPMIRKAIETRLTIDPIGLGKPLTHDLKGLYRLRVSDYRIVYSVDVKNKVVTIVTIKHRKDVYEKD